MSTPLERESRTSRREVPGPRGRGADRNPGRCRSFCFLEREGERWTVFLVTYGDGDGHWRGYFTFRTAEDEAQDGEIRTADLFVEASEAEVDARARGLGRPLVSALLESALHAHERRQGYSPDVQQWFRELLARHSAEMVPEDLATPAADLSLANLRSLYDSYRIDQVTHLITLIRPKDFAQLVDRVLDGQPIDFRSRDKLQLAMMVVQEIERHLPLPPFEVWIEDYIEHSDEYHRYTHALHRAGELP